MERRNNYQIQAQQAKNRFLTYDQRALIAKFRLQADEDYLYAKMLCKLYRISRTTGDLEFEDDGIWRDGNTHEEVMTMLDLLCDSREDRHLSGTWRNMQSFGLQFHRTLLEEIHDPTADWIQAHPMQLETALCRLNAEALPGGDKGFALTFFENLRIGVLFWAGDEEFLPRLRFLWDENTGMYIRYETMYFAVELLRRRLREYGA